MPWCAFGVKPTCDRTFNAPRRAAGQSTRPNPTANFAGVERTTILPAQPSHGRRRALPVSKPRRGLLFQEPKFRLRNQQLGVATAVAGMIALTALTAAHADPGPHSTSQNRAAATAAPAMEMEAAVSAAPAAVVNFDRPTVTSQPAPARAAGAVPARVDPAGASADAAPTAGSKGLRAPLASMNVSSPFGLRVSPITGAASEMHTGIDLTGSCATAVFAAGAGTVTEAGWSPYGGGNRIVVDHGKGMKTTYNHLASIGVSVGQVLAQGQQIAGVGTTGASTGCHLHFEVMVNGQTVDPASFVAQRR